METLKAAVGEFAVPVNRNIMPWGTEPIGVDGQGWHPGEQPAEAWDMYRFSDAALEALVFDGTYMMTICLPPQGTPPPLQHSSRHGS